MRVTKYPQSCFRIEKDGRAILIDIGNFATRAYSLTDLQSFEAILVTHQHADHIDPNLATWLKSERVPIYANQDVADKYPQLPITVLQDGQSALICGFQITARDLPHCKMPDGSNGPPNTGYVIDDRFFHPGDGIELSDLTVDTLAAPIAGPSVSLYSAVKLARQVQAKKIIPMHYDNPAFYNDPQVLKDRFTDCRVVILKNEEEVEV